MMWFKHEIKVFFTALMFYSRLPCPSWVDHSANMLDKATRYFPFIGWIVAGISGAVFFVAAQLLSLHLAIVISMIASILTTGAFHEDGWADVCDGFGGGWTKEKILSIMKDSVIGAYGVIGVVLILLLKYLLLTEIASSQSLLSTVAVLFSAHALSRLMAVFTIKIYSYVRENEDAKAKPVAKQMPVSTLIYAIIFGLSPLIYFQSLAALLLVIPPVLLMFYMSNYFKKCIGGYTGDCLGAIQQVTEVTFYLSYLLLWKFI